MRYLLLFFALLSLGAMSGGFLASAPFGAPCMRTDAQGCIQNQAGGHALLSIENVRNPGDNVEESAISFGGFSDAGAKKQMASISAMWGNNASGANGRGILRFNVDGVDESNRVDMIMHGKDQGMDIFCHLPYPSCEQNAPGGPFLRMTRTVGWPTIAGRAGTGMVLNGDELGQDTVWINAYGKGVTVLSAGGGQVQIGTPVSNVCPNGWKECLRMLDSGGATMYVQVGR